MKRLLPELWVRIENEEKKKNIWKLQSVQNQVPSIESEKYTPVYLDSGRHFMIDAVQLSTFTQVFLLLSSQSRAFLN